MKELSRTFDMPGPRLALPESTSDMIDSVPNSGARSFCRSPRSASSARTRSMPDGRDHDMGILPPLDQSAVQRKIVFLRMGAPDIQSEVLAASFRNFAEISEALLGGADILTVPSELLMQVADHPLSGEGHGYLSAIRARLRYRKPLLRMRKEMSMLRGSEVEPELRERGSGAARRGFATFRRAADSAFEPASATLRRSASETAPSPPAGQVDVGSLVWPARAHET